MLVSHYTAELMEGVAETILYTQENGRCKPFMETLKHLRRENFDLAIVAYPRFRLALLLWLAGIPYRVGTGYRWYSLLFNKRVYEHRRTVEKHEAEYNISLLSVLGCTDLKNLEAHININEKDREVAKKVWKELGFADNARLIILHPGSGGSARNWKPERFSELAKELAKRGFSVAVTGTQNEKNIVDAVTKGTGENVKPFISNISLKEFAAFIESAKLFVSNSTGPLHIAAVVGTPVIGFYPPVLVMSPKRWGPLTDKKAIFVPDPMKCPICKNGKCRGSECMDQIGVKEVVETAIKLIDK